MSGVASANPIDGASGISGYAVASRFTLPFYWTFLSYRIPGRSRGVQILDAWLALDGTDALDAWVALDSAGVSRVWTGQSYFTLEATFKS